MFMLANIKKFISTYTNLILLITENEIHKPNYPLCIFSHKIWYICQFQRRAFLEASLKQLPRLLTMRALYPTLTKFSLPEPWNFSSGPNYLAVVVHLLHFLLLAKVTIPSSIVHKITNLGI